MMQVWCYDENMIFTESIFVDKIAENMTTVSPNGLGLYCKKWDYKNKKWVEGLTEEEIQSQKQIDNCPSPPPTNEELNNQLIETQKLCLSLQKQILLK